MTETTFPNRHLTGFSSPVGQLPEFPGQILALRRRAGGQGPERPINTLLLESREGVRGAMAVPHRQPGPCFPAGLCSSGLQYRSQYSGGLAWTAVATAFGSQFKKAHGLLLPPEHKEPK